MCLKIRSQDSKGPGASRIQTVRGPPGEDVSVVVLVLFAECKHVVTTYFSVNYV